MDWATIIPLLLGSGVALVTSVSVEYLRYRQTSKAATQERENAIRQQSREGLHTLVTQVQDSLQEMILLAASILDNAVSDEQEAAQRARFRDVMIGCVRLVSRLPDEEWRTSVKEVISLANRASTPLMKRKRLMRTRTERGHKPRLGTRKSWIASPNRYRSSIRLP